MEKTAHEIYCFDEFRLDLTRGSLFRGTLELKLRPQSFDVLKYLTENHGRLVSKDELIDSVWHGMAVTDDSLVQCLKDIRRALGDDTQQIIKTIPRRGYIFEKEVTENGPALYVGETSGVHLVIEESEETNGHGSAAKSVDLSRSPIGTRSLVGIVKRHKLATALALASMVLAASGIAYGLFTILRRPAPPTPFRSVGIKRLTTDGKAELAAISQDGNYIAYQINEPGGLESLWVRQVTAVNPKQIVPPAEGTYTALSFSRDGNFVNFVQGKTLYQVPTLGGSSPRKLWDGIISGVTFSPDGIRVAFVRRGEEQSTQLTLASADGTGEPQVLATRDSPEFFTWGTTSNCGWSPNGETIVCVGGDNGGFGLMYPIAVRVSDGKQTPLTVKRWNYAKQVSWLADGSGVILNAGDGFEANSQLWHISVPEGVATRIYNDLNGYEGVSISADSRTIVTVQSEQRSNLFAVDPHKAPRHVKEITTGPERTDGDFAFTPDGKIVLVSQHGGARDLWIMNSDGSDQKALTNDPLMETMPTVSPDGRSIVFVSNPGIWKIDIDGSSRRQVSKTGLFPEFSPDGEWIVYTSTADKWTLWKMRSDGSDAQKLTDVVAILGTISPDGTMIAYIGKPRSPEPNITIIPFAGGEPIKILSTKVAIGEIAWTPDGRSITHLVTDHGIDRIVNQPIDGGAASVMIESASEDKTFDAVKWSLDGRLLYYTSGTVNKNAVMFSLER